ncbi:MAG: rhomboid family intramembrane serine protease [Gemmatimonadota bacterium]
MATRRSTYGSGFGFGFGFGLTPWVKRLMIANAVVFVITPLLYEPLALWLAFTPSEILTRPWGIATYMFVHGGFWHIFFNMLVLFFFGPPLEATWGSREFLKFYLVSGLGGAVLSFIFAPGAPIVGASAAVYGVMLAFAMNWPNSPIYIWGIFPIKAKWLVAFMFVVSLYSAVVGAGGGIAHFAHLGGFLTAFLYLRMSDPVAIRAGPVMEGLKKRIRRLNRPRLRIIPGDGDGDGDETSSTSGPRMRSRRDEERLLDEVDRVLDKISTSGLSSLTAEERRLLDDVSRRYRKD